MPVHRFAILPAFVKFSGSVRVHHGIVRTATKPQLAHVFSCFKLVEPNLLAHIDGCDCF
jgi:hypothetical protein